MLKRFIKIIFIFILLSLSGCIKHEKYLIKDYLKDLAYKTGIDVGDDYFSSLCKWNVIDDNDKEKLEDQLTYIYLKNTIDKIEKGIDVDIKQGYVSKNEALEIIERLCLKINDRIFETKNIYTYKDEIESDSFEDVYDSYQISSTFDLNLDECEIIIPSGDTIKNSGISCLSNTYGFSYKGYRISYSLLNGGLSFRISKTRDDKFHSYIDVDLRNLKPSFNWDYDDGVINEAYLKLGFDSTIKFGVSFGKYLDYAIDFKNADKSNVVNLVKSIITKQNDDEDIVIPLCTINTPIPNLPTAFLNLELGIHIYASGKAEIIVYNSSLFGFEIKNNQFRMIKDFDNDLDFTIASSFKSSLGINMSISSLDYRLFDFEIDSGIKAKVGTTIHLYNDEYEIDESYSSINDLTSEDNKIKVCGDLSLAWLLDIKFNTYKTLLYKLGFSRTISLLDDDDQVFVNLSHIENGQFVKSCTRKRKKIFKILTKTINTDKIILNKYSIVLKKGEVYDIVPYSMPTGYSSNDLLYANGNEDVCSIENNIIKALNPGSSRIKIYTSDLKYEIYLNVLVSYE